MSIYFMAVLLRGSYYYSSGVHWILTPSCGGSYLGQTAYKTSLLSGEPVCCGRIPTHWGYRLSLLVGADNQRTVQLDPDRCCCSEMPPCSSLPPEEQARSQGGFGGFDRTPLLDQSWHTTKYNITE